MAGVWTEKEKAKLREIGRRMFGPGVFKPTSTQETSYVEVRVTPRVVRRRWKEAAND